MRTVDDFKVGERVSWAQDTGYGLRHSYEGVVVKVHRTTITIKLDDRIQPVRVSPHNVRHDRSRDEAQQCGPKPALTFDIRVVVDQETGQITALTSQVVEGQGIGFSAPIIISGARRDNERMDLGARIRSALTIASGRVEGKVREFTDPTS